MAISLRTAEEKRREEEKVFLFGSHHNEMFYQCRVESSAENRHLLERYERFPRSRHLHSIPSIVECLKATRSFPSRLHFIYERMAKELFVLQSTERDKINNIFIYIVVLFSCKVYLQMTSLGSETGEVKLNESFLKAFVSPKFN